MTTTATLTDRYVHAVLRSVPEARREEIGRELRSSIDDMVEARTADGDVDGRGAGKLRTHPVKMPIIGAKDRSTYKLFLSILS